MITDLSNREWVIGLYDFRPIADPSRLFAAFYETMGRVFSLLGLEATHMAVEGEGYSGKAQKAQGVARKRLLESEFNGITTLVLICNPVGSDAPAYDRFVSASLGIATDYDALLCFTMNDGLVRFGGVEFNHILEQLAKLYGWGAGYALADTVERQPDFHVMGLDNGELSSEELESLTKWYCSTPEYKMTRIRSVYPVNLLNERQLSQQVHRGQTLLEFIQGHAGSTLSSDSYGGLRLWLVGESDVESLRSDLSGCEAVIS